MGLGQFPNEDDSPPDENKAWLLTTRIWFFKPNFVSLGDKNQQDILLVESQIDVNTIQRCSVENQKGTIPVQQLWQ